jgi:putative (di)nucleoside polyphosphate hydrolase
MNRYAHLPYRLNVGIMLLNRLGQVFIAQRIDNPGPAWQMPQGGIDAGEEPWLAALRELREEIGTANAEILAESTAWLDYDLPEDLVEKLWKGRFRGQRQKWYAMLFLGDDSEVNLETEHPEFNRWRWAELDEVPEAIVPFKRGLYDGIVAEFRPVVERIKRSAIR